MDIISTMLPLEIISDILYKYNGLQHPTSILVKDYFKELNDEFNIYKHIEQITERTFVEHSGQSVMITSKTEYKTTIQDYPRLYFPPQLDLIVEKIISHII